MEIHGSDRSADSSARFTNFRYFRPLIALVKYFSATQNAWRMAVGHFGNVRKLLAQKGYGMGKIPEARESSISIFVVALAGCFASPLFADVTAAGKLKRPVSAASIKRN